MPDAAESKENLIREDVPEVIALIIVLGLAAYNYDSGHREFFLFIASGPGAFFGAKWFYQGIRDWRFRRKTEDIPTSKIKTGAVGTDVEVKGFAISEKEKRVKGPITGKECVLYHLEIQVLRQGQNSHYWKSLDSFFSDKGFFLDDDSGAYALVLVDNARFKCKGTSHFLDAKSKDFDALPAGLLHALQANKRKIKIFSLEDAGLNLAGLRFSQTYRFIESRIDMNEYFYVRGFAGSGLKKQKLKKSASKFLKKAKQLIKKNKELQERFDTDQDGQLDFYELERGAQVVAERLSETYSKEKLNTLTGKTKMFFEHKKGHPLYISNYEEEELVESISKWTACKIIVGPMMFFPSLAYLIWAFVWSNWEYGL